MINRNAFKLLTIGETLPLTLSSHWRGGARGKIFRSREALDTGRLTTVTVKSTSSINQSRDIIADEEQEAKKRANRYQIQRAACNSGTNSDTNRNLNAKTHWKKIIKIFKAKQISLRHRQRKPPVYGLYRDFVTHPAATQAKTEFLDQVSPTPSPHPPPKKNIYLSLSYSTDCIKLLTMQSIRLHTA